MNNSATNYLKQNTTELIKDIKTCEWLQKQKPKTLEQIRTNAINDCRILAISNNELLIKRIEEAAYIDWLIKQPKEEAIINTSEAGIFIDQHPAGHFWKVRVNTGKLDFAHTIRDNFTTKKEALRFANRILKHHKTIDKVTII